MMVLHRKQRQLPAHCKLLRQAGTKKVWMQIMRKALVSMNGVKWGGDKKPDEKAARAKILAEYSARGIDFHSWRHWFAKNMADHVDMQTLQEATGHKTAAMLEHYADHELEGDLARLGVAAGEAFKGIL